MDFSSIKALLDSGLNAPSNGRKQFIVDGLSAQNRVLTSSHDAKVPFGRDIPKGNRKIFIQRHK